MNRKDILIDFTVYLLLLGDEFHNDGLHFFDSREKNGTNYENYVNVINKLVNVEDFIWDTDLDKPISKIKTLNDLIPEKEIEFFQEYINTDFSFGYPNEINEDGSACGGTYNLNLTIDDMKSYFEDYIELRKSNTLHYITYYQQFLNYLSDQSRNTIETTKDKIDNFYNSKSSIDSIVYSKLKDKLESKLETNLLNCTQNTSFQVQGGFDKYGFILNHNSTLKAILKSYNSKYSKLDLEIESKQYYALVEYEYYLFKIKGKQTFTKTDEQKNLENEFVSIKEKNSKQIQFLKDKSFDNREIDIILNWFSLNKFNQSNLRYIRNINKIEFFGLFYFFYRFEFLKEECNIRFDAQNDFLEAPLIERTGFIDPNMYHKYYKHSNDVVSHYQEPNNDYPFKKAKKLLIKIKSELHIDLNKLNIPSNLRNSIRDLL
ncbi:MAG: hypothetical protein ACWIPJ_03600 [Polaribacter sp.]